MAKLLEVYEAAFGKYSIKTTFCLGCVETDPKTISYDVLVADEVLKDVIWIFLEFGVGCSMRHVSFVHCCFILHFRVSCIDAIFCHSWMCKCG